MKLLFDESLSPRLVPLLRDLFPESESALRNRPVRIWRPLADKRIEHDWRTRNSISDSARRFAIRIR
jgi:predicted nuclease of predicted toxin-antitoxin system